MRSFARRLYPELLRFRTPAEARIALRRAKSQLNGNWPFILALVLILVPIAIAPLILPTLGVPLAWRGRIRFGILLGAISSSGVLAWVFRRSVRRSLCMQLVSLGVPICITCSYDLAHCQSERCPECGTIIRPRIVPPSAD